MIIHLVYLKARQWYLNPDITVRVSGEWNLVQSVISRRDITLRQLSNVSISDFTTISAWPWYLSIFKKWNLATTIVYCDLHHATMSDTNHAKLTRYPPQSSAEGIWLHGSEYSLYSLPQREYGFLAVVYEIYPLPYTTLWANFGGKFLIAFLVAEATLQLLL